METANIPTIGSPGAESYSDIRADSFGVLTSHYDNLNASLPINHPTLSLEPVSSFENIHSTGAGTSDCVSSDVIDSNSMYLNANSGKQGDTGLPAINSASRCSNSSKVQSVVDSIDGHTKQRIEVISNNQCTVRITEDSITGPQFSTGIKIDGTSDPFTSSSDSLSENLEMDKSEIKTCQKEESGNQIPVSSSVKIVTTASETGTLQMFLIDDPDVDFDEDTSNSSLHVKTYTSIHNNASEEMPRDSQKETENKGKLMKSSAEKEEQEGDSLKNEHTNDNLEEVKSYSKPSRRSLRLKAGKRSTPSLCYKIYSDHEDLTDAEYDFVLIGPSVTKTSGILESKSAVKDSTKPYACDMCSITCKTASNLRQHKQTHNRNEPNTCSQCGYTCKRKSDMRKHVETHGPKSLYKCMECDYSGKRLRYLKKHMRIHNKDISFSCHLCDYRSQNKAALDIHLLDHSNLKAFSCVECGENFKRKSDLHKHTVTHSSDTVFSCDMCGASFKVAEQFKRHEAEHMQDIQSNQSAGSDMKSSKIDPDSNGMKESDMSGQGNSDDIQSADADESKATTTNKDAEDSGKKNQEVLGTVRSMNMKGGPVQCTLCSYSCASKNLLARHMMRHSDNKPHLCQQCGASFKRKDHLKVHKLTHGDVQPYKCSHCSYTTHRKYRLKLHVMTHQNIEPVKCSMCEYSSKRDTDLRHHMRNKHGIEPEPDVPVSAASEVEDVVLTCELCDYTCDSQKRLKYHMTRHENKTPLACPHCDYKCSSRSSMSDHLLQHAGIKPCLCSVCGMAFRNTSRLNRHKLVHSDVKPYGCSFCDFSSRSKYNLKQHVLRHTDQERARRRNRRPTKPKNSNSSNTEDVKQYCHSDVQSPVQHMDSNLYLDNVQSQRDGSPVTQDSKNNSKFKESFESVPIAQSIVRNQMGSPNNHYKQWDRNIDQNNCGGYNNVYQNPSLSIHPYHIERPSCQSAMNSAPTYNDSYQNPNPFISHPHSMSYNVNLNTGSTNPDFCYMDRSSSGYGFANQYFYNETVFPGNMNSNMNFYMCPSRSNAYALSQTPSLPVNQNTAHLNSPVNQMTLPVLPPAPASLLPIIENESQPISETDDDDSHMDSLTLSEDISLDVPANQGNESTKPTQSRSQAKKTGATLDGGKFTTKDSDGDNAAKSTYICSECGYICLTNTMLQRHKTTHFDMKPHKCDDCGKSFKRLDHMKAHKRTHSQDKPFNCKHCTYTCSRKYRLKLHEMTHIYERPFSCTVCESTFDAEQELEEHTKVHSGGFMFACNKCDFKCKEKSELRFHNETHKTFLCGKCSYVCRSSREFNSHKQMHAEKEELICSLCSYTCDSQKRLKYHMERHENKTPHECPHCDYKCSSRSSLTDHLLQHEGLKPFLCSICGMKFRNVSRLNRHKMTHTDLKPHTCEYCPFSSRSRYNLKQHMLRHFK